MATRIKHVAKPKINFPPGLSAAIGKIQSFIFLTDYIYGSC